MVQVCLALVLVVLLLAGLGWLKFKRDERLVSWVLHKSAAKSRPIRRMQNAGEDDESSSNEKTRKKASSRKHHSADGP